MTLHCAAKSGDITSVIDFYEQGISLDIGDEHQNAPLHYATEHGHYEVAEFLIDKKCALDVADSDGNTPLWIAVCADNLNVADLLRKSGAVITLHLASRAGWLDEVASLVASEAWDINAKNYDGDTPLSLAANKKHKDVVEFLIKAGADVNCSMNVNPQYYFIGDKWTILHFACRMQWLDIVKTIVERNPGVDLDVKNSVGDTPLAIAACSGIIRGDRDTVEFLIKSGANLNCSAVHEGYNIKLTFLQLACHNRWSDIVRKCIQAGCDMNTRGVYGGTPLHRACAFFDVETLKVLLEEGADFNIRDNFNKKPLILLANTHWDHCSISNKISEPNCSCPNIIRLFMNHGAIFECSDYSYMCCICKDMRRSVFGDVNICTQALMNKHNNVDLPSIYRIPSSVKLPSIKVLKMNASQSAACEIEEFVIKEIATKGICNVVEKCPPVLQMLSIKAFRDYYK